METKEISNLEILPELAKETNMLVESGEGLKRFPVSQMDAKSVDALKKLAVKLGCAESVEDIQGETISEVIQSMDENAPFGVETLLSWDGNIDGKEFITNDTGNSPMTYYKITDEVFELSDFIGALMYVSGVTENGLPLPTEVVITEENTFLLEDGVCGVVWEYPLIISVNRIVSSVVADNSWLDSATNGIYVLHGYLGDSNNVPPIFCSKLKKVKTLDSEYLPVDIAKIGDVIKNVVIKGTANGFTANMDFETALKNLENDAIIVFFNASSGFRMIVPKFEIHTNFIRLYLPTTGDLNFTNAGIYLFKPDGSIEAEGV